MDDTKTKVEEHEFYDFICVSCKLSEKAHYKGTKPPFSCNVVLKYPSYVMKDPFSPPGKGEVLMLGADCAICEKTVCISKECSVFCMKLFCINCAKQSLEKFPVEIQGKINSIKK